MWLYGRNCPTNYDLYLWLTLYLESKETNDISGYSLINLLILLVKSIFSWNFFHLDPPTVFTLLGNDHQRWKSSTFIFMEGQIFGWIVENFYPFSLSWAGLVLTWDLNIDLLVISMNSFQLTLKETETNTTLQFTLIKGNKCYYFEIVSRNFCFVVSYIMKSLWKTHCSVDEEV